MMQDIENPQPIGYVTFDPVTGVLTGSYFQVLHPDHADCHIPVDEATRAEWVCYRVNAMRNGLDLLPPVASSAPTEAQIVAGYMAEVQRHMDGMAVVYGYDNLLSVITYAEAPEVERYQVEGQAFRAWRSLCWAKCEEVLAAVQAGEREAPSHVELIGEMPALGLGAPAHFTS